MAKEKIVTMEFEIGNMFMDEMILRNIRKESDIKRYFMQFGDGIAKETREILTKNYVIELQKKEKDDGCIDLVIETKEYGIIGVISIANMNSKKCIGKVATSIPDDDMAEKYMDKTLSMLIEYCKENYMYDDLFLDKNSEVNERYIEKHKCKRLIPIIVTKETA